MYKTMNADSYKKLSQLLELSNITLDPYDKLCDYDDGYVNLIELSSKENLTFEKAPTDAQKLKSWFHWINRDHPEDAQVTAEQFIQQNIFIPCKATALQLLTVGSDFHVSYLYQYGNFCKRLWYKNKPFNGGSQYLKDYLLNKSVLYSTPSVGLSWEVTKASMHQCNDKTNIWTWSKIIECTFGEVMSSVHHVLEHKYKHSSGRDFKDFVISTKYCEKCNTVTITYTERELEDMHYQII